MAAEIAGGPASAPSRAGNTLGTTLRRAIAAAKRIEPWHNDHVATITKRQREQARIAKQKDKAARRADRARQGSSAPALPGDVDPDIADIRPGPQPLADWQIDSEE